MSKSNYKLLIVNRLGINLSVFLILRFISEFLFWGSRPEVYELMYAWIQYPAFIGHALCLIWIAFRGLSSNPVINPVFYTLFAGWMMGVVYMVSLDAGGFLFLMVLMSIAAYHIRKSKPVRPIQFLYILFFLTILFVLRQLKMIPPMIWFW